ncbi:toll-like receptor 3 [Cloeon dipterum]|uniref:toll-like receptor 3 n=1 Tax=Cloeon dipterum TaxID=197152 RepID=UPI00321FD362
MADKLYFFIFNIIISLLAPGVAATTLDAVCDDLHRSRAHLRPLERTDCALRDDLLTCTVRIMSESLPQNATATEYHAVVRVNLDYRFRFRVLPPARDADDEPGVNRACLVLLGVAYTRVRGGDGERRTKVPLPKRLFNLAANSVLLGADSDLEPPGVAAGIVTFDENSCPEDQNREERPSSGCIREVSVSAVDVAEQLNLVLRSFNYSFAASGFPDRSSKGHSVVRNLPTDSLHSLRIRGGLGSQGGPGAAKGPGVEPDEQQAKALPVGFGVHVTELDLSFNALGNISTLEPGSDRIQRLNLSHSNLEKVPEFVQHQKNLKSLVLDGNPALIKVGGGAALKEALKGLNQLQELQLSGVQTEVLTVDTLPALSALSLLNMSRCGLRHVSEGALSTLPALQRLDLSANELAVVPASLVVPCPRLRHLNLARNKLVRGPKLILSLLHDLDVSSNALQSVDDIVVEGRVVTLHLAHNIIRSLEGARFSTWAENVDVSHNLISALSLRSGRREVEGLVSINLNGNPFDCNDCNIVETQVWLNETMVLVKPSPALIMCSGAEDLRVMDVLLPECVPTVDLALLIVAPVLALLAMLAALLAVIGLRRAGWLNDCSICCGVEDDNDIP